MALYMRLNRTERDIAITMARLRRARTTGNHTEELDAEEQLNQLLDHLPRQETSANG